MLFKGAPPFRLQDPGPIAWYPPSPEEGEGGARTLDSLVLLSLLLNVADLLC